MVISGTTPLAYPKIRLQFEFAASDKSKPTGNLVTTVWRLTTTVT